MKLKKMFLACLLVCGLLAAWSFPASAAWYTCTVNSIGVEVGTPSFFKINLTDANTATPAWPGSKTFSMQSKERSITMPLAATAIVSGNKVKVDIDLATSQVWSIYLLDN